MFSNAEKTTSPSHRSQAAANNLSETSSNRLNLLQAKNKDIVPGQDGAIVQMVGKKGHIAIGAALGTLFPVVGNIAGGLIGYAIWKHKQKNRQAAGQVDIIAPQEQPAVKGPREEEKQKEPDLSEEKMPRLEHFRKAEQQEVKEVVGMVESKEGTEQPALTGERVAKKGDRVLGKERSERMAAWLDTVKDLIKNEEYREAYKMLKDPASANIFGVKVVIDGAIGDPEKLAKKNTFARQNRLITLNMPDDDDSWLDKKDIARRVMPMHLEEYMHAYQSRSGQFLSAGTSKYKKTGKLEESGARKVGGHADYDEIDVMAKLHDWKFNVEDIGYVERYAEREKYWDWLKSQPVQLMSAGRGTAQLTAFRPSENRTGMPDQLKTNMESMSGFDLSNVRVHYNSSQPAQLNALAYAQGNDIHIGAGQEQHLSHEAWHVVQQRQGRVQPTLQMKGIGVNDDPALESEADRMGEAAMRTIQ